METAFPSPNRAYRPSAWRMAAMAWMLAPALVFAQQSSIGLQARMFGNLTTGISQAIKLNPTSDQGYLMVGGAVQGSVNYEPIAIKTDFAGNIHFSVRMSLPGMFWDGVELADGSFALAGTDNNDIFLCAVDECGSIVWSRRYDNPGADEVKTLIRTSDGGFLLCGTTRVNGTADSNKRPYLLKTNATGDLSWARAYGGAEGFATDVVERASGGYVFTGRDNVGLGNPTVVATDASGNVTWGYRYALNINNDQGTTNFNQGGGCGIREAPNGDLVVFLSGVANSGRRAGILRVDASGAMVWNRYFTDTTAIPFGSKTTGTYGGIIDSDGSITLLGYTSMRLGNLSSLSELLIIKADALGNSQWGRTYSVPGRRMSTGTGAGFQGQVSEIHQLPNGGYAFAGQSYLASPLEADMWLVKTLPSGTSGCNYFDVPIVTNSSVPTRTAYTTVGTPGFVQSTPAYTTLTVWPEMLNTWADICSESIGPGADEPTPSTGISGATSLCSTPTTATYAIPALGPDYTYTWSVNGGTISSGQGSASVQVNWTSTQSNSVSLTLNGPCNSTSTFTLPISIGPLNVSVSPTSPQICAGESVQLQASGAASYAWSPSGGLSCTDCPNPVASPQETTVYQVTATADGCSDTQTVTVEVTDAPALTFSPQNPVICGGESVSVTVSGSSGYTWSPATGLSCTSCANPTANPASTTTYTVSAGTGNCISSAQITVSVADDPVITVLPAEATLCPGESVSLSASGADTYSWSPSAGLSAATGAVVTASPANSTTYTVTGTSNGCSGTTEVEVSVVTLPAISFTPGSLQLCSGEQQQVTVTGADSYQWSPGTGLSCTDCPNPTVGPSESTSYTVEATASGCTVELSYEADVFDAPVVQLTAPSEVCTGQAVTLSASGAQTYSWSTGQSGQTITLTPTADVTVTVTGFNGPCPGEDSQLIDVLPSPDAQAGADQAITSGESVQLNASGVGEYSWSPVSGLSCPDCADPLASPEQDTEYCVTVTNEDGCTDQDCMRVTVEVICGELYIPNMFSPNDDLSNDTFCLYGTECLDELEFRIVNRWGQTVFYTTSPSECWDGQVDGQPANAGAFAYSLTGVLTNGSAIQREGSLTLVR